MLPCRSSVPSHLENKTRGLAPGSTLCYTVARDAGCKHTRPWSQLPGCGWKGQAPLLEQACLPIGQSVAGLRVKEVPDAAPVQDDPGECNQRVELLKTSGWGLGVEG